MHRENGSHDCLGYPWQFDHIRRTKAKRVTQFLRRFEKKGNERKKKRGKDWTHVQPEFENSRRYRGCLYLSVIAGKPDRVSRGWLTDNVSQSVLAFSRLVCSGREKINQLACTTKDRYDWFAVRSRSWRIVVSPRARDEGCLLLSPRRCLSSSKYAELLLQGRREYPLSVGQGATSAYASTVARDSGDTR